MNRQSVEAIVQGILDIIGESSNGVLSKDFESQKVFMRNDVLVIMQDEGVHRYREIFRILDKCLGDKFSSDFIENQLNDIIAEYIKDSTVETIRSRLAVLTSHYASYDVIQTVYVPIAGIELSLDSLQLCKVNLVHMSTALCQLAKEYERKRDAESGRAEYLRNRIGELEKETTTTTCGIVTVIAEPTKALEIAVDECRFVRDLLVFGSVAIYHESLRIPHGIGLRSRQEYPFMASAVIGSDGNVQTRSKAYGPIQQLELNLKNLGILRELGVFFVSDIYLNREKSQLEMQILRSIHWFAESQVQSDRGNEILGMITVLEMFFTTEEGEPIGEKVAECTALLVNEKLSDRQRTKRFVKQMYRSRSDVVHGRELKVSESNVASLRFLVLEVISRMIKNVHGWQSTLDVKAHFDECRLRG